MLKMIAVAAVLVAGTAMTTAASASTAPAAPTRGAIVAAEPGEFQLAAVKSPLREVFEYVREKIERTRCRLNHTC